MTVGDLKELLEELDEDTEIKLAMQPSYPMRGSIRNLCVDHGKDGTDVLWIACSDHLGYDVCRDAWDADEIYHDDED